MIARCLRVLGRLCGNRRGALLVETAMTMPVLIAMVLGGVEVTRFVLLRQSLDRAATSVGDLVSQAPKVTEADITNVFDAVQHVISPFEMNEKGLVIITCVGRTGVNAPHVNWQRTGAGTMSATSQVGAEGGDATIPAGFQLSDGETAIVAEVYYQYEPLIFPKVFFSEEFYHRAYFRPRLAPLDTIEAG